jgi:hypothetical protein
MTKPRQIALVVRKIRMGQLDEHAESLAFWAGKSPEEKLTEAESLRQMWPELTGDANEPLVRVLHRRRLGDPPVRRPTSSDRR